MGVISDWKYRRRMNHLENGVGEAHVSENKVHNPPPRKTEGTAPSRVTNSKISSIRVDFFKTHFKGRVSKSRCRSKILN